MKKRVYQKRCKNCGKPLPEGHIAFCSEFCQKAYYEAFGPDNLPKAFPKWSKKTPNDDLEEEIYGDDSFEWW